MGRRETTSETPPGAAKPGQSYNQIGQKIGSKGRRTRQLLIDTTVTLLDTHGLRDLSVVDVARAANTSPATFYVYFRGVPEVVLAALEDTTHTTPQIEALIAQDWMASGAVDRARELVLSFTDEWNRHRTIFTVRNLACEEGDARFLKARTDAAQPMMRALADQVRKAQTAGLVPSGLSAQACAGAIIIQLERLASVGPIQPPKEGLSYGELQAAAAFMIACMLGGRD